MYALLLLLLSFTAAQYDKLAVGDSLQTAEDLLGPATALHYESGDERCLLWEDGDVVVTVTFRKGRVVSKWQVGL
jgi:hypothetical protein